MSTSRRVHRGGLFERPGQLLSGTALLLFVGWVWLVASFRAHEMIVGVIVVVLSTSFSAVVLRSATLPLELRGKDILQLWRLPGEVAQDAWVVTCILFRDLFLGQPAGSFYRVAGFEASPRSPVLVARAALAITYATLSPNTIVIGIDATQGHMLFHQLRRDDVSGSARALGAGQ